MRASSPPSPCCYKAVLDPPPGSWLSLNLNNSTVDDEDQPFCQEPDTTSWSTTPPASSLPHPSGDLASAFRAAQLTCDTVPSPAAKLNITASEIGSVWYNWRLRLREHNLLNHSLSREGFFSDANADVDIDDDDDADDGILSFEFFWKLFDWLSDLGGLSPSSSPPSAFNETTLVTSTPMPTEPEEFEETSPPPSTTTTTSAAIRTELSLSVVLIFGLVFQCRRLL